MEDDLDLDLQEQQFQIDECQVNPIWISKEGKVFWTPKELGTEHLENICAYIPARLDALKVEYKSRVKRLKERRKMFIKELKRREKKGG
jgi:hypothetical protein